MRTSAAVRRSTRAVLGALLLGLCALLGACAASAPERRDVVTASDETNAERRARLRLELAGAYFGRGQNSTALDEVKQAISAKPDLAAAHNMRGLIYAAMNEPQLAEESFRRALQLNPRDSEAMHNYGWFLCQQRRYTEADLQFQQVIALPNYRDSTRSLLSQGVCQARANQLAAAERTLARAYELDPGNPTTAINLSEVLYREGEFERARFYVRRVNTSEDLVSAQTLWLALRIERRLGQSTQVQAIASQLRNRYPDAPETLLYAKGQFDE